MCNDGNIDSGHIYKSPYLLEIHTKLCIEEMIRCLRDRRGMSKGTG